MPSRIAIRRLRLAVLAPHDHPAPRALESRLAEAARTELAPALEKRIAAPGDGILRIRRLLVDITLDGSFDDAGFATLLAGAIAAALRRAADGDGAGAADSRDAVLGDVVVFPDQAGYLAALVEALASGRAGGCWWLRDADGLLVLPPAMAVRTALLADPAVGEAALQRLPPVRLATVLAVLGGREAARVMDGLASAAAVAASAEAAAAAAAAVVVDFGAAGAAASMPAPVLPLALYLRAVAVAGGGPALAAAVRLAAALADATALREGTAMITARAASDAIRAGMGLDGAAARQALAKRLGLSKAVLAIAAETGALPDAARRGLAERRTEPAAAPARDGPRVSHFAGLLLLVPGLEFDAIAEQVAAGADAEADTAALITFAALGLCAGRRHFAAWLHEPVWRALFGLDPAASSSSLADRLGAIPQAAWLSLAAFGGTPPTQREARFLLPRRPRSGGWDRPAVRTLAMLANGITARFAARLIGLRTASAPFLWDNLLGAGGVFEHGPDGWEARLNRPPLDVLVSLSRLAEGSVRLPCGTVRLSRAAP